MVGFGCVTTLLLVIILVLGVAIIYLITRGKRYQYTPPNAVLRTQSESSAANKNQIQEQPPPSSSLPPIPPTVNIGASEADPGLQEGESLVILHA